MDATTLHATSDTPTPDTTPASDWRTEVAARAATIDAALAAMGITYDARFIPQGISRNRDEKTPSLNWLCRITRHGFTYSTDYTQGIAHVPNYPQGIRLTNDAAAYRRECERAAETGTYPARSFAPHVSYFSRKPLPAPALCDVVYSLLGDADAGRESFADFCANYGYDEDSRSAETLWRACGETARAFSRLFSSDDRATLADLFTDYWQ